jgi:hypothetical protein
MHLHIHNKYILYITQTWMPQKENEEWSESFILKQTHFSMNNDMQ